MDVPDLYSAIVEEPVPDGLSEVVHIEEIYKKWQHQQQEQCRLLETIRDLAEENKRILKERDELRDECDSLKKSNSVYKKNAQLIYSVCRCEINKRERRIATLERKLSSKHPDCEFRDAVPSDHDDDYYGKVLLNLDTELKYTGILTELNNDTTSANQYSKNMHGKISHHSAINRDTPFDCRPFRGPKTPPTPNCGKGIASKTRPPCEQLDRKRIARPSWDTHYDSRNKYCRYEDYDCVDDYYNKEKRCNSRMDYRRSYSSERKYDRRDAYSSDRSNYARQTRDDDRSVHHSNNRLSYSQNSRHSERGNHYEDACYDRSRSTEEHYRNEWNDCAYRRSRDSYSRDASRDRQRKSLEYEQEDGYHDHRSRFSRRNYEYDVESTSQSVDDIHRPRKYHDTAYHSKSVERYRDEESANSRPERHGGDNHERYRPINGQSHFETRSNKRPGNDVDSRSCSSSSRADRSIDRSQDEIVESSGNFDSNFSSSARDDCAPDGTHPKRDNLRRDFDVKELSSNPKKTVTAPLSPSSSSSPSQVESASDEEDHTVQPTTKPDVDDTTENSRTSPPPPPSVEVEPKRRIIEAEPKRHTAEAEPRTKAQEVVSIEMKSYEGNSKLTPTSSDSVTSPEAKKKLESCSLTAAETKLRKLKESKPILFTKVKDTSKTEGMDYIKTSLETSFRHDVSHYTSKQIHVNTGPKEGHLRDEFVVLEGLRIQKAEEEAAREDNFVLGSEYKKSKCDQEHPNAPTESVYTQRMREKLEREKELAARAVVINRGLDQALSDCDEPDVSKQHMPSDIIDDSPQSPSVNEKVGPVSPSPMEEVVEEEFDVTDNLVTEIKSPELVEPKNVASSEVDMPLSDRYNADVLPNEEALSKIDSATINSTAECDTSPERIECFDVKSPVDTHPPVVEMQETTEIEKKKKLKSEKRRKRLTGEEPSAETLEWDCEVDLHLEEVDTADVAEEVGEELLSADQEEENGEEECHPGEVEEGEILDDSEPEGGAEEETAKKKKRSRRLKAKPKIKEKWKGKKGQKNKKTRITKEIASGRRAKKPALKSNAASRLASPEHEAPNPSKIDLRSRDKKASRLRHHEPEVGTRVNTTFAAPNRRRAAGDVPTVVANPERRVNAERISRSEAVAALTQQHRREAVKEPKRFRGRVSDEGSTAYHELSPFPARNSAAQVSKLRHYDQEHRFRRK